jgi:hypothetical protein
MQFTLDPSGDWYMRWLGVVTIAILYNFWSIILRVAFGNMDALPGWLTIDYMYPRHLLLDLHPSMILSMCTLQDLTLFDLTLFFPLHACRCDIIFVLDIFVHVSFLMVFFPCSVCCVL